MDSTSAELRLLAPRYRWTTVGSNALIFLGAFEALAVMTIMPTISEDLDGESLYSLAFSGNLAASIIGMVVAGGWADRRGPTRPLLSSIVVFLLGLVLSGLAINMQVFIGGRLLQGLGSGAISVALYVVVARIYPAALHPKIFGAFAAAWVIPSLVGPPIAGVVAERISWHWVFLGVVVLVLAASALIAPALAQLRSTSSSRSSTALGGNGRDVGWAVLVSLGILAISIGGDLGGAFALPVIAAALALVVIALRPLLPRGTLLVQRGLPATVLLRGTIAATFFATEIYLPYLLGVKYGLPPWAAGLILTVGAVSWALGSAIQARLATKMSNDFALQGGAGLLVVGIAAQFITAMFLLSPVIAAVGWFLAGGGMGLIFPRLSTIVLANSTERDQGFNSAAITIADAAAGATAIAFSGLLFAAAGSADGQFAFAATLAFTTAIAVASIAVAFRARSAPNPIAR